MDADVDQVSRSCFCSGHWSRQGSRNPALTVHLFQTISRVVHSQQTTLSISIAMPPWRIFVNSSGIARSFSLKQHVFVYGQMVFKTRSWTSRRKSRVGLPAWLTRSTDCAESSQHGFNVCNLQGANHLKCRWPHPLARSSHQHHPAQRLPSQWSQLRLQYPPRQVLQRMHHFRWSRELIHGLRHGRRSSTSDRNWWCDCCSSSSLWEKVQLVKLIDF